MKKIMFALVSIILISACIGAQTSTTTTSADATTTSTTQAGQALPDLYISDDIVLKKVATGDISMSATIFNKGKTAAENVIVGEEVKEKATGKLIYPEEQMNKGNIGAGGSQIMLKFYSLSDGDYTLTIRADPVERISESDESNNILTKDFSVPLQ